MLAKLKNIFIVLLFALFIITAISCNTDSVSTFSTIEYEIYISDVQTNSLTVNWNEFNNTNGYTVTRYYYQNNISTKTELGVTNSLDINDTGLKENTLYFYSIKVFNESGESFESELVPAMTLCGSSCIIDDTTGGTSTGASTGASTGTATGTATGTETGTATGTETGTDQDTEKPTVEITTSNGRQFYQRTGSISGTASDNVGIEKVLVKLGENDWVQAEGTVGWLYNFDLDEDEYLVQAKSVDKAGNESDIASISISVKQSASGTIGAGGTVTQTGTSDDPINND